MWKTTLNQFLRPSTRLRSIFCTVMLDALKNDICDLSFYKGCLPCFRLTADERELLWHRRHYLLENPAFLPKVLKSAHGWDWACLADIYILLQQWQTPSPTDALELLMPQYVSQLDTATSSVTSNYKGLIHYLSVELLFLELSYSLKICQWGFVHRLELTNTGGNYSIPPKF